MSHRSCDVDEPATLPGPRGRSAPGARRLRFASGAPTEASVPAAAMPTLVGGCAIEGVLGRGGMGVVYRAFDLRLQRPVALKALPLHRETRDEERSRLEEEARAMARVLHPNVAVVYGLVDDAATGTTFLALELVEGRPLNLHLEGGALAPEEARRLLRQVAKALAAIHHRGLVHRDLKPGNVIVTPEGRAKVLDFGLATVLGGGLAPAEGHPVGSPGYMSPEQAEGRALDLRADVWAWGCVAYECLTGRPAFEGADLEERLAATRRGRPDFSPWPTGAGEALRALVESCLSSDPEGRPRAMEAILHELDSVERAAAAGARRPRHFLPSERDAFVGRRSELAQLDSLFSSGARLVTLFGPGGVGKTRLAQRQAWRTLEQQAIGAWFCDLSEARDLEGIVESVAAAFDVPLSKRDPVEQLGHVIAGHGPALIVLDNFEHLAELAEATLGRWLGRAPDSRFLVTSRARLRLAGEVLVAVEPLRPETEGLELFVRRAQAQQRGFELTEDSREELTQLVRLLDGLPLAIELAAARVRVLSPARLLRRMSDRFAVLRGPRDRGSRQATLEATIDWSWDLLRPWEQAALVQCSVFEGGFSLDAAEAVLDLGAWPDAPPVLDVVQSLLDESLLRSWTPEDAGRRQAYEEPFFGTWASIEDYAARKLRDESAIPGATGPAAAEAAERRHGAWHARFGSRASLERIEGPEGPAHVRALGLVLDDLVVACRRAVERDEASVAVACLRAAWAVLGLRGPFSTGIELARQVRAMDTLTDHERTKVLRVLATALGHRSEPEEANAVLQEGLLLARSSGERGLEAVFLDKLATADREQGRPVMARERLETASAIQTELGNHRSHAGALHHLGNLDLQEGRREDARRRYRQALEIAVRHGDRRLEMTASGSLGLLQLEANEPAEAEASIRAAIRIASERGDSNYEASACGFLGNLLLETLRFDEASEAYGRSVALAREVGDVRAEGITLGNLAQLERTRGRNEPARRHLLRALELNRFVGNRRSEGAALYFLALLDHDEARLDEAARGLQASIAILREVDHVRFLGVALRDLGAVLLEAGRLDQARASLEEGLTLLREAGDTRLVASAQCVLAELDLADGERERARRLLEQAEGEARRGADATELSQVLAVRTELALSEGRADLARQSFGELERSLEPLAHGPGTAVGRRLEQLRGRLNAAP